MTINHRSPIFQLSDEYIAESASLSPIGATFLGIKGYDDQLDDFSLAGSEKTAELVRRTLQKLVAMKPQDEIDRVAKAVMEERLKSGLALHDSREQQRLWGVIASPASYIRQVFEMMAHETEAEIHNITARLNAVAGAHESWISSIDDLAKEGKFTSRRQALAVAEQLDAFAKGAYSGIAKQADPAGKYPELHTAGAAADKSAAQTSQWLKNVYALIANPEDAVGEKRYSAWARHFTGAQLDLRATYEWGMQDLAQINDRMWKVAAKIMPEAKSLRAVADHLDADPQYLVKGKETLLKKLKDFTQEAVKKMDGVYFDIDDRIKFCDARIAPEGSASAPYYQPPSEDLSRPGTTWYPALGKDEFTWWHLASTWYHEAVPGHHLQCATVIIEQDRLSRFQRTEAWTSGYGEGWALYAERLMDELGAFEDPGLEMGYLSGQALRAARVVVDIGMHLGYADYDGKVWNAESAREVLMNRALLDAAHANSEVDRYLGWPGQAISYKVGERVWMKTREDAKQRLGGKFSLKKFHTYALKLGPMGLDPFEAEIANWDGN
ncbi:MAG TPA: DUF885 domain-containing protein [Candidatus Nanopelagicaceae bacterium]